MIPALPPQPVVVVAGAAALFLTLLPLRGLPRDGEVARRRDSTARSLFHLGLGILSIGLLGLALAAREKLQLIEPFKSNVILFELSCALASVMAVSPLMAILATGTGAAAWDGPTQAPAGGGVITAKASLVTKQALFRFALALPPLQLLEWAVLSSLQIFGAPAEAQSQLLQFRDADFGARLAMIASIAIAAPIAEEVVFRGTLQPAISRFIGADLARLSVAVLFGSLHGPVAGLPIGVFGYFLGRVRDAWGRLAPCIAIHALNNLVALLLFAEVPYIRSLYK
ncbi:MAG: CPBP family intramembrane metalloprotease [Planctomycetes bacterium]|nr:CPBP family intramembrane metalloprotease [Planctomycetota bacterium]